MVQWGSRTLNQACFQAYPGSAMCVQNFDDSRGPAIRITYRISLRSSSLWEPRHPLLKVVLHYTCSRLQGSRLVRHKARSGSVPCILLQVLSLSSLYGIGWSADRKQSANHASGAEESKLSTSPLAQPLECSSAATRLFGVVYNTNSQGCPAVQVSVNLKTAKPHLLFHGR